ncbi:MAG: tetratricopeptide repeat protein [Opitutaceae bacterium]
MPSPVQGNSRNVRIFALAAVFLLAAGCASRDEVFNRELQKANTMVNEGDFAGAIEILVPLNEERPNTKPVVEALAFAYAGNGDHTLAAWHMIQLADLDPAQTDLRLLAAESLETAGDPVSAIEQYRLYVKSNTQDASAWQHLAELCRSTGDPRGAIEALLACQTLEPSAETAFTLGDLFRSLNNLPQAQVWYATAAREGGATANAARLNLLELSIANSDFTQATEIASSLRGKLTDPDDLGRFKESEEKINAWKNSQDSLKAARINQDQLAAEVARLQREQEAIAAENARRAEAEARAARLAEEEARKAREAATLSTRSSNADPETGSQGDAQLAVGNPEAAIAAYWQALNENDSQPEVWLNLSRAYMDLQQWTEAESCVLEARRRDRRNPRIEETYLQIVRRTRPYDQFLVEAAAARERFPQSPDLALLLADALSATGGDTLKAIRAYEDFLLLAGPDDPRIQQAQNTLDRLRGW